MVSDRAAMPPLIDNRTRISLALIMAMGLPLVGVIRWLSSLEFSSDDHERRLAKVELQSEAQAKTLADIRTTAAATETKVDWLVKYFSTDGDIRRNHKK